MATLHFGFDAILKRAIKILETSRSFYDVMECCCIAQDLMPLCVRRGKDSGY